jgi:hypothetical protein
MEVRDKAFDKSSPAISGSHTGQHLRHLVRKPTARRNKPSGCDANQNLEPASR